MMVGHEVWVWKLPFPFTCFAGLRVLQESSYSFVEFFLLKYVKTDRPWPFIYAEGEKNHEGALEEYGQQGASTLSLVLGALCLGAEDYVTSATLPKCAC